MMFLSLDSKWRISVRSVVFVTWLVTWINIQTHLSLSFVLKSISSFLFFSRLQTLALIYDAALLMFILLSSSWWNVTWMSVGSVWKQTSRHERHEFNIISSLSLLGHSWAFKSHWSVLAVLFRWILLYIHYRLSLFIIITVFHFVHY